jgi:hypothetical protein
VAGLVEAVAEAGMAGTAALVAVAKAKVAGRPVVATAVRVTRAELTFWKMSSPLTGWPRL